MKQVETPNKQSFSTLSIIWRDGIQKTYLRLNKKEIGSMLSIVNSSVLTARYRLKRKLGLPQQKQLDTWIQSMGQKVP